MGGPPTKKRKQTYNHNVGANKRIESGIFGLFFTCDGHEKQAVGEAKSLIDDAVQEMGLTNTSIEEGDKTKNEENNSKEEKEEDIVDALAKEIAAENDKSCKNSIFLTTPQITNSKDIYSICDKIVHKCQESLNTRYLQRIEPVEVTCEVNETTIEENIKALIDEHFREDLWVDFRPTFAINFRSRNNGKIKKNWVIEMIGSYMKENYKHLRVDLNKPNLMINVSIVCRSALLGIIQSYSERRKLSLRPNSEAELNSKMNREKDKVEEDVKSEAETGTC